MNTIISSRIAAIIYAITIAVFGVRNIMKADSMNTIVPTYMPGGTVWVYVCGVCMVLAAIEIILNNRLTRIACYLLALMLLIFVCMLHLQPAIAGNPANLLKDTGLAIIIGNNTPGKIKNRYKP
ncbi:MAG: DoxX family protein [Chitinophagaceae bacterium]|nr:DoxX family protein [Chitinophagaceae bacterium]